MAVFVQPSWGGLRGIGKTQKMDDSSTVLCRAVSFAAQSIARRGLASEATLGQWPMPSGEEVASVLCVKKHQKSSELRFAG